VPAVDDPEAAGRPSSLAIATEDHGMGVYAALDVSQELTAICVIDDGGALLAEGKVATCPDAIATWLGRWTGALEKVGMETGPLAVWLWNTLTAKGLPVVCLDARHASAALKMMPNKTDRHDARASHKSCAPAGSKRCASRATRPTSCGR
jgi:transposase